MRTRYGKLPLLLAGGALLATTMTGPASAHEGDTPHVPDAYYANFDHLVWDKSGYNIGVGDGWGLVTVGNYYENQIQDPPGSFTRFPNMWFDECELTTGPCIDVIEECDQQHNGTYGFDRNISGPVHGQLVLNRCWGSHTNANPGRDQSITCRAIGKILGEHEHTGAGCTSNPWYLSANRPSDNVLGTIELTYLNRNGCQIPCTGPGERYADLDDAVQEGVPAG